MNQALQNATWQERATISRNVLSLFLAFDGFNRSAQRLVRRCAGVLKPDRVTQRPVEFIKAIFSWITRSPDFGACLEGKLALHPSNVQALPRHEKLICHP
jgi:hypothetical protein